MNYYELIYLIKDLNIKFNDATLDRIISPQKNILECYMGDGCLRFHAVPPSPYLYIRSWQSGKKKNVVEFFPELYGKRLKKARLTEHDRYLGLQFDDDYWVWFEVFGSKTNAYLWHDDAFIASFKRDPSQHEETFDRWLSAQKKPSHKPEQPSLDSKLTIANLKEAKERILEWNPNFERNQLDVLLSKKLRYPVTVDTLHEHFVSWEDRLANHPKFQIFTDGTRSLLPAELVGKEVEEEFQEISDLIYVHATKGVKRVQFKQRYTNFLKQLNKLDKNVSNQLLQLNKAISNEQKASQWEEYGHLIMTLAHKGYPNSKLLSMNNLFNENQAIDIQVQPEKTFAENATLYYERAQKARATKKEVETQIPILKQKRERIQQAITELEGIEDGTKLDDWYVKFQVLGLVKSGIKNAKTGAGVKSSKPTKPYFAFEVFGYSIWIGKHARSNDEMLSLAHKEDIWLHAKGVSGSHVIIRSHNKIPNKAVIEQVAAFAAYQSKARGSAWVPVIFTPKKYVRKAKDAPPGAVIVQKEEVVMVQPEAPKNLGY